MLPGRVIPTLERFVCRENTTDSATGPNSLDLFCLATGPPQKSRLSKGTVCLPPLCIAVVTVQHNLQSPSFSFVHSPFHKLCMCLKFNVAFHLLAAAG